MNDEKDLLLLFDQVIEEESHKKLSKSQIKESERLQKLYKLSNDNIDEIFEDLLENTEESDNKSYLGKRFGNRIVIEENLRIGSRSGKYFRMKCDCGQISNCSFRDLMSQRSLNCRACSFKIFCEKKLKKSLGNIKIGDRFGNRIVISLDPKEKKYNNYILTQCDCGHQSYTKLCMLKKNQKFLFCNKCKGTSIQHTSTKHIFKPGDRYGARVVVDGIKIRKKGSSTYAIKMRCDCGKELNIWATLLIANRSRMCRGRGQVCNKKKIEL